MNKIGPGCLTIAFVALGLLDTCLLILIKIYGQQLRPRYFDLEQEEEEHVIAE